MAYWMDPSECLDSQTNTISQCYHQFFSSLVYAELTYSHCVLSYVRWMEAPI